jgi:hypothetical protein
VATATVRVEGLDQLVRDFRKLEGGLAKEVRDELGEAGKIVAVDARARFEGIQPRSAASMRMRLRGAATVVVEQRRGKTTGKRGDFGSLQMRRAFVPALESKSPEVVRHLEQMLDRLGRRAGF